MPLNPITCNSNLLHRQRVGRRRETNIYMFPIRNVLKQGDDLSPLLFNFALDCAIRRVQVNQVGLKLNGTHQLLAYVDDVNILGRSVHSVKQNAEALVVATKETRREINADKTKYLIMSRDQNVGRSYSMKIDNNFIESVEEFKYLGTTLRYGG